MARARVQTSSMSVTSDCVRYVEFSITSRPQRGGPPTQTRSRPIATQTVVRWVDLLAAGTGRGAPRRAAPWAAVLAPADGVVGGGGGGLGPAVLHDGLPAVAAQHVPPVRLPAPAPTGPVQRREVQPHEAPPGPPRGIHRRHPANTSSSSLSYVRIGAKKNRWGGGRWGRCTRGGEEFGMISHHIPLFSCGFITPLKTQEPKPFVTD